jgi:regulator of replication initiation timing
LISDDELSNQIKMIDSLMKIKQRIDENDKNVAKIQGQIQQIIEENKTPKKKFSRIRSIVFPKK